jgi:hypothetical protein
VLRLLVRLRATQFRDKECRPPNAERSFAHRNCFVSLIDAGTHRMNRFMAPLSSQVALAVSSIPLASRDTFQAGQSCRPKNVLPASLTGPHRPERQVPAARKLPCSSAARSCGGGEVMRETLQAAPFCPDRQLGPQSFIKGATAGASSSARSEGSLGLHASGGLLQWIAQPQKMNVAFASRNLAFGAMHPPVLAHVGTREIIARFEQRSASPRNQFTLTRSVAARPYLLTSPAATG